MVQKPLNRFPELAKQLSNLKEPQNGNPFAALLEDHGVHQESVAFRSAVLALSILYGLGQRGLWDTGRDLEVLEVGGGYGLATWMAATAGQWHRWRPVLGFQTWTIFDLAHVSALQAWFLRETLPRSVALDRFCAKGLAKQPGGFQTNYSHQGPEVWSMPRPLRPTVRLVDTALRDIWLYSDRLSEAGKLRVMMAMCSWTETELQTFLWYFNHLLPLVDYLLLGYSKVWTQSKVKYEMILQEMEPIEEYPTPDGHLIVVMKPRSKVSRKR